MAPKRVLGKSEPTSSTQHRVGSLSSSEGSSSIPPGVTSPSSTRSHSHQLSSAHHILPGTGEASRSDILHLHHSHPHHPEGLSIMARNPPASLEVPITYTPTTGRVSKAKKGKRVHSCEFPGCGKVFTRAEHRRRHQLNHNPEHSFPCKRPGCGKAFHRLDLLQRHEERQSVNEIPKLNPLLTHISDSGGSVPSTPGQRTVSAVSGPMISSIPTGIPSSMGTSLSVSHSSNPMSIDDITRQLSGGMTGHTLPVVPYWEPYGSSFDEMSADRSSFGLHRNSVSSTVGTSPYSITTANSSPVPPMHAGPGGMSWPRLPPATSAELFPVPSGFLPPVRTAPIDSFSSVSPVLRLIRFLQSSPYQYPSPNWTNTNGESYVETYHQFLDSSEMMMGLGFSIH